MVTCTPTRTGSFGYFSEDVVAACRWEWPVALAALGLAFRLLVWIDNLGVLTMICLMIYVGPFAMSRGPILWLVIAEIYPLRVGGLAAGVATTANRASNLLASLALLTLAEVFGLSTPAPDNSHGRAA